MTDTINDILSVNMPGCEIVASAIVVFAIWLKWKLS